MAFSKNTINIKDHKNMAAKTKIIFDVERYGLNTPLLFDLVRNRHANTIFIDLFLFIM